MRLFSGRNYKGDYECVYLLITTKRVVMDKASY